MKIEMIEEKNVALRATIRGKKFGKLTTLNVKSVTRYGERKWKCHCACERIFVCDEARLLAGCVDRCLICSKNYYRSFGIDIDGANHSSYKVWYNMVNRCLTSNPKIKAYYKDRGIGLSDSWKKFENFYKDMTNPPENRVLSRIDKYLGYSKDNCKWMTQSESSEGKRWIDYGHENIDLPATKETQLLINQAANTINACYQDGNGEDAFIQFDKEDVLEQDIQDLIEKREQEFKTQESDALSDVENARSKLSKVEIVKRMLKEIMG